MPAEPAGHVLPAYGAASLADVVPAVARAIGVPLDDDRPVPGGPLDLPPAPAYVVLLLDGLGARQLQRYAYAAPYLSSLLDDPAHPAGRTGTACVPSTTTTSLTSFGTGLTPGGHGLVGFTHRIPGTERLLNALSWPQDVDPVAWQPHPTTFERLTAAGAEVTVVNKRAFATSGLTRAAHRGGRYVGADSFAERVTAGVAASAGSPSLTYLYDSDLDGTGHRHGVASQAWLQVLDTIDGEAEELREALPSHVRLLVVSDHGMVDAVPEGRIDVDEHRQLRDGLLLLGGEARFRQLYCRDGAVDDVAATWRAFAGDRADVLTREEAIARGWFGAVTDAVRPRIGDLLVAARGQHAFFSSVDFGYETSLVGLHGSLTDDEMTIPLLLD